MIPISPSSSPLRLEVTYPLLPDLESTLFPLFFSEPLFPLLPIGCFKMKAAFSPALRPPRLGNRRTGGLSFPFSPRRSLYDPKCPLLPSPRRWLPKGMRPQLRIFAALPSSTILSSSFVPFPSWPCFPPVLANLPLPSVFFPPDRLIPPK